MKNILVLAIALLPHPSLAECMGRGYFGGLEEPRYNLESCVPAGNYFSTLDIDNNELQKVLGETTVSDMAVLVTPLNEAAQSVMRGNDQEYWHFVGDCRDMPLSVPVEITDAEGHCSDLGPTKYLFLGDYTIKAVRLVSN